MNLTFIFIIYPTARRQRGSGDPDDADPRDVENRLCQERAGPARAAETFLTFETRSSADGPRARRVLPGR